MGKRSSFERVERDFYPTPYEAVAPLMKHLGDRVVFDEPCAGNGALVNHLVERGHICWWAGDIKPMADGIHQVDAFDYVHRGSDCIITNPPWDRSILHPMITHFSDMAPTWLLFDADWMHTRQSSQFMERLVKIVSVGRVKWIPDSKMTGKDNCAWYLFDKPHNEGVKFYGR